ncbi:MAG: hypothetical protein WAO01_20470 [Bradyrhizobium sp.]|jgi:hypothetical protein
MSSIDSNVVKFPYSASRRVYSKQPRRSKNGTPEERAAKAAAALPPSADIVALGAAQWLVGDRRKLRGNPLREQVAPISFAVTVVGKLYTADLRQEPLDFDAAEIEGWVHTLRTGAHSARFVADELDKAVERLMQAQGKSEISHSPLNLPVSDLGQPVLNLAVEHDG